MSAVILRSNCKHAAVMCGRLLEQLHCQLTAVTLKTSWQMLAVHFQFATTGNV